MRLPGRLVPRFHLLGLASKEVVGHATCLLLLLYGPSMFPLFGRPVCIIHTDLARSESRPTSEPCAPISVVVIHFPAGLHIVVPLLQAFVHLVTRILDLRLLFLVTFLLSLQGCCSTAFTIQPASLLIEELFFKLCIFLLLTTAFQLFITGIRLFFLAINIDK